MFWWSTSYDSIHGNLYDGQLFSLLRCLSGFLFYSIWSNAHDEYHVRRVLSILMRLWYVIPYMQANKVKLGHSFLTSTIYFYSYFYSWWGLLYIITIRIRSLPFLLLRCYPCRSLRSLTRHQFQEAPNMATPYVRQISTYFIQPLHHVSNESSCASVMILSLCASY